MYARSTSISGDADRIDAAIDYVRRDAMPVLTGLDGCVGMSMIVEREPGRVIVTSAWESRGAMQASDAQLGPMRARGADIMAGIALAQEWEVAVMHRDHASLDGACCRVTWMRLDRTAIDRGVEIYRRTMLPEMEQLPGFCSASLMVDRERGQACSTTTYDSRAAMEESRDRSWTIRDAGVREAGVDVTDVGEFDLVLAHLRVPELV
ncbi:antibiotic biosynthesis monooxygenase [Nocardioides sp.]|uniref:antibiotic biosynthesis monooxygenase n=1 Tax=Nocardioides sp. TaxID=35761 RepID=UPI0035697995